MMAPFIPGAVEASLTIKDSVDTDILMMQSYLKSLKNCQGSLLLRCQLEDSIL